MNTDVLNDYCLNMNNSKVQELVNGTYVTNELSGNRFRFPPNFDITKLRGKCNPKFFPELYEGVSKNPADYGFEGPQITSYSVPEGVNPTEYINACDAARQKEASGKRDSMNINQQIAAMQQIDSPCINSQTSYNTTYTQPETNNGFNQNNQMNYGYQQQYNQTTQQVYANPYAYQQQYNQMYSNPYGYQQQYNNQMYVNPYQQQMNGMAYYGQPQMYDMNYQQQYNQMYSNPYAYQQPQQGYNYNPSMAQQISYANNYQQMGYYQPQMQQMNGMAYYGQQTQMPQQNSQFLNSSGKPKTQLYYSLGRCYNVDGSDGELPADGLGDMIRATPQKFDDKTLREEFRQRQRAVIEYAQRKDCSYCMGRDVFEDFVLVNPTPDPNRPETFEWNSMHPISAQRNNNAEITDEHYYDVMRKMYNEGKISFNTYAANANAGLEHINENGYHAYAPNGFRAFGFGGTNAGYYNPYATQQQEMYDNHNKAMARAFRVMQKGLGITDEEVKAADERAQKQATADFYKQQMQRTTEMQQNAFTNFIKQGKQSDEKDYISPAKYKYMKHYNTVFDARHKHIDPDMSFYDFMCNGGYADIYFADIKYQNKLKMDNLVRVYDDPTCRAGINQFASFYDMLNAISPKGFTITDSEIHIEVPPEIAARHYNDRRETFFNKIFNRQNAAILPTDAEFFATQYSAPQFANGLSKSQVTGNATNPSSSGGWVTASPYGNQQYYQNPSGYMRM